MLHRIDATNEAEFNGWFDVLSRSEQLRSGGEGQGWHPDEWRARAVDLDAPVVWHLYSFADRLGPSAIAGLEVAREDNLHMVRAEFHVDPDLRRQGIGSAALEELESVARQLGRQQMTVHVIEGPNEVGTAPNRYFAPRCGYRIADELVRRELLWPRPDGEIDQLWLGASDFARDYDVISWVGTTPEDLRSQRARLSAVMPSEAPYADLEVGVENWDEARVVQHDREVNEMGRELLVSAARHRDSGELVGYSELTVSREFSETAYQWDTLVIGAHRGHRLGLLMKLANLRLLEKTGLKVERISTFNSSLNAPMIEVNERLGTQVAGSMVVWRKDL